MKIADKTNVLLSSRLSPVFIQQSHSKCISIGMEKINFDKPTGTGQTIIAMNTHETMLVEYILVKVIFGEVDIFVKILEYCLFC